MNEDERLAGLLAQLEKITRTATQQQIEIALLKKEVAALVNARLQPHAPPASFPPVAPVASAPAVPLSVASPVPPQPPAPARNQPPASAARTSGRDMEAFVGGNLINKVGMLILVIGLGIFVKYAIDNNLVGPVGRIAGGYLAGLALVGLAYRLKASYLSYSAVLLSGGLATVYFTTFFAYDFYALLPHAVAYGLMVAVTLFTVYAAASYRREVIGVMGLVGAYAVPVLLSQDTGRVAVLFTYMGVLDVGVAALAFRQKWRWMNITAFVVTWGVAAVWFADSYTPVPYLHTALGFGGFFFLLFYAVFVFYQRPYDALRQPNSLFVVVNTFVFFWIGYAALEQAGRPCGAAVFSAVLAAVHGGAAMLMRRRAWTESVFYLAVGLALFFGSLAVQLYFSGLSVPLLWAAEAAVLAWAALRSRAAFYGYASLVLVVASTLSLNALWEGGQVVGGAWRLFANRYFLTGLGVVAAQAAVYFLLRPRTDGRGVPFSETARPLVANGLAGWVLVVAYAVVMHEIGRFFAQGVVAWPKLMIRAYEQRQVWRLSFSAAYVAGLLWLVRRHLAGIGWQVLALGLGLVVVASWFFIHLSHAEALQLDYVLHRPGSGVGRLLLRYVAYAAVAACLWAGTGTARRLPGAWPAVWMLAGHFFVLAMLGFEVRNAAMLLSRHPEAIGRVVQKAGYSVLWGVYALGLVAAGIRGKRRLLRMAGIALLGLTLLKLFVRDLSYISPLGKIVAFVALGVLLLVISFLYQRFKDVILADDDPPG